MTEAAELESVVSPAYVVDEHVMGGSAALRAFGHDRASGEEVFIKIRSFEQHDNVGLRTHNEAEILDSISHPQVPKLVDADPDGEYPYIVTERMPGDSISIEQMRRHPDHVRAARLIRSTLLVLGSVHEEGVVHGDVTLSNLVASQTGSVSAVDFELAHRNGNTPDGKPAADDAGPVGDLAMGTYMYMPPERFRDHRTVTPRGDLYAAGIAAFAITHGAYPFSGSNDEIMLAKANGHEVNWWIPSGHEVPSGLRTIIDRAIQPDPAARYGSAEEMVEDLDRLLH